jgi:peptidoglycan/xylan/chitin deacetylase (PgdA/CDA1 family)
MPAPVTFFFRDDDAGWDDSRLRALLDRFARHDLPLDVAVIPAALNSTLGRELERRVMRGAALGLHQHGYAHANHESTGRKCEFGPSRKAVDQYMDIESGKRLLTEVFGEHVDPIFTPPWNRCTQVTVVSLCALGFRALSRDADASDLDLLDLIELPVSVDWRSRAEKRPTLHELGQRLAQAAARTGPVGIMLHHAVMDDSSLDEVEAVLALLAAHPRAQCVPMRELGGRATSSRAVAAQGW